MSIILFSRPVQTGKTTELQRWCDQQNNVAGILMPVILGKRKIYNLVTKELTDIECNDPGKAKERLISVGRYHFYDDVFKKANTQLTEMTDACPEWLIVDEVGKLELEGKGFYPAVKRIIEEQGNKKNSTKTILVVREGLCDAVTSVFKIKEFMVIDHTENLNSV